MLNCYKRLSCSVLALILVSSSLMAAEPKPETESQPASLPLAELRLFTEIYGRIKQSYVEPVSDAKLLEDAVAGMLAGLDPHSNYLNAEDFISLNEQTKGEFGGLGIEIDVAAPYIRIIAPIDDTPAARAGIQAGDLITKIDGQSIANMPLSDAVEKMRGKVGDAIELTLVRKGETKPLTVNIVRALISVNTVKSRMLEPGFAYVRISKFQQKTVAQLHKHLQKLKKKKPLQGLVLDLRNNPGGLLKSAVAMSDTFLSTGVIVSTEGRLPDSKHIYTASAKTLAAKVPLLVLINEGSASASEIVAGALQDHQRALIVGAKSFGKGSVQTVIPLPNQQGLKLTTARYFTPKGRSIQAQGISPDIYLPKVNLKLAHKRESVKEKDLPGHLRNQSKEYKQSHASEQLLQEDFALFEALNLLKAMRAAPN